MKTIATTTIINETSDDRTSAYTDRLTSGFLLSLRRWYGTPAPLPQTLLLKARSVFRSRPLALDLWILQGIRSEDRKFTEGFAPCAEIFYATRVTVRINPVPDFLVSVYFALGWWMELDRSVFFVQSVRAVCVAQRVSVQEPPFVGRQRTRGGPDGLKESRRVSSSTHAIQKTGRGVDREAYPCMWTLSVSARS